jgi:hypothetical protein
MKAHDKPSEQYTLVRRSGKNARDAFPLASINDTSIWRPPNPAR